MPENITIVGAGIGGLTAALALLQRGVDVTVCEQAAVLREVGAGVQLSPNGCRVLASLGLLDELRACAVAPEGKEIRLWSSGQTWPLFDLGPRSTAVYGFPYLMVHRGDLQMLLARAVERARPGTLLLDARMTAVEQHDDRVVAVLHDGRRLASRVLVGADGFTRRSARRSCRRWPRDSPAAWPGADWSRRIACPDTRAARSASTGSVRAGTSSPIRCAVAS